jgi:3-dehydroquinate dehydratase-1
MELDFESFVLAAATTSLEDEPAARPHADAIEFRMDLLDGDRDPLAALEAYDGELPVIATNRTEREGGDASQGPQRLDVLRAAAEFPAVAAVDVELATVTGERNEEGIEGILPHVRTHDAKVIVSTHDFEHTPRNRLSELLGRTSEYGDVGKVAVTAQDPGDVLELLRATHQSSSGETPIATMAMGEAGRHSRVVAPLYGSKIGYAPVDPAQATAPGQYDLATIADLIEGLQ